MEAVRAAGEIKGTDLSKIVLDKNELADFENSGHKEWIITNGLGGFASSTAAGANARKYHGLLTASFNPPVDRYLLLSKIEEEISSAEEEYFLSCNMYSNKVIQPRGHLYLEKFELSPNPVFTYKINQKIILTKKVFMVHGRNATVVKYTLESAPGPYSLKMYPLVTFRDFHSNTSASAPGFVYEIKGSGKNLTVVFKNGHLGEKKLFLTSDRAVFKRNEVWNHDFLLYKETERGEESSEDLLCPGRFSVSLKPGESVYITACDEDPAGLVSPSKLEKSEDKRVSDIACRFEPGPETLKKLAYSADSFIVSRRSTGKKTIIAGYHWFSDWGRDTMISLCGLTLVTKKFDVCRDILSTFSENIKNGIVPNRFSDNSGDPPEYNAVDASLWYFYALYKYYRYTKDIYFIENSISAMKDIIDNYIAGTDFNIKMDASDGLVTQGDEGVQLTWMDAKVNGFVVTPRSGKAVEINALWYNALCVYKYFLGLLGRDIEKKYEFLIGHVKNHFAQKFKSASGEGLYDVIDCAGLGREKNTGDISKQIRPNQIFAVFLPFSPLDSETAKEAVETVEKNLLTPFGLRSLAPGDAEYKPRYEGARYERDCAYHQGTVWPYLIGPFISAKLRVNNYDPETLDFCAGLIGNFEPHLKDAGLMSISEIFDAENPHRPAGCISQAWSVAEIMRAVYEDLEGNFRLDKLS